MKVYSILVTVVVEDKISDSAIAQICKDNIETAINEDLLANCITHYELKETIDYQDLPIRDTVSDILYGDKHDNWMKKSQEVIDRILVEMRNP